MKHTTHAMHENSLFTWAEEQDRLGERARTILENLRTFGRGTDREICQRMGFTECNSTRPRITELRNAGLVREVGSTKDSLTGKTVRVVEAV
jgi:hypothetical protein